MSEIDILTSPSAGFLSDECSKQDWKLKKMALLEKLWDELVDRSETNCRLAGLRKITTPPLIIATDVRGGKCKRNRSVAGFSAAAVTPTAPVCKDSIFPPAGGVEPAAGSFFHKTQPSGLYNGVYSEGGKGKQPLLT